MTANEINLLRDRLKNIIRNNPETAESLSKQIGISQATLMKFLSEKSMPDFKRLYTIEAWVIKKENTSK